MHEASQYQFNRLSSPSIKKYSLVLHRLVLNCLRFYVDPATHWKSTFQYPPLSPSQVELLKGLVDALQDPAATGDCLMWHFEACVRTLLCHLKSAYPESASGSRFFSPVCSFVVIHCVGIGNGDVETQSASNITQMIAPLMYCVRAAVLWYAVRQHEADPTKSMLDLAKSQEVYLKDQQETPMAFMFNALKILTKLRENEGHVSKFKWVTKEELSYGGDIISFRNIRRTVEGLEEQYLDHVKQRLMFNLDDPSRFKVGVDVSSLVEDESSTALGYSFLDDPRNDLAKHRSKFGLFLLSHPDRPLKLAYYVNSELVWIAEECEEWLRQYEESLVLLATGLVLSAGPSARASEIARYVLREMVGARRNVGIVFKNISLNSTSDKTSQRRQKDHFVPHVPTPDWQEHLLHHLCFIRPFAEFLVSQLFAPDSPQVTRFYHYLWPGLNAHMENTSLSDAMGAATRHYIGTPLKSRAWRSLVTVIFREYAHEESAQLQKDFYYDRANMHSTTTADAYYSGNTGLPAGCSLQALIAFLKVSQTWHQVIGLVEKDPIPSAAPPPSLPEPTAGQFSQVGLHDHDR